MWLCVVVGVLAVAQCEAKKIVTPPVTEIEAKAGRDSPKMACVSADRLSAITWKVGRQELKQSILDEKWEDLQDVRFEKTVDDTVLQIKQVTVDDRMNVKCEFQRNVTSLQNNGTTSFNVTETKTATQYFRVRVRDPLGAVWPTVGILVEAVALFILITVFEYVARNKSGSK